MPVEKSSSINMLQKFCTLAAAASSLIFTGSALAAPITFDFNTVALSGSYSNGLGALGSSTNIATYMNSVLATAGYSGATVSVTGALATKTYDGEGHVSGQTLGTSDNGVSHQNPKDTFLINNSFGVSISGSASDQFSLSFNNFLVQSVEFDWEIFPDATCAAGSSCANSKNVNATNWPDISLLTGSSGTQIWYQDAPIPSNSSIDPQGLGVSGLINIANGGTNVLTFRDWPATIGIDNLKITGCLATNGRCNTDVPEPATSMLLGVGLAALGFRRYKSRNRA